MAFLDIERIINQKNVDSRFKLVHLASLRARELNNPDENTVLSDLKPGEKVTSKAISDIVRHRVQFIEIDENTTDSDTDIENISENNSEI